MCVVPVPCTVGYVSIKWLFCWKINLKKLLSINMVTFSSG